MSNNKGRCSKWFCIDSKKEARLPSRTFQSGEGKELERSRIMCRITESGGNCLGNKTTNHFKIRTEAAQRSPSSFHDELLDIAIRIDDGSVS